tara:strand:- start:6440 stop:6715 length:276 start_codon:yes stop_codon:yes gene_type:complete
MKNEQIKHINKRIGEVLQRTRLNSGLSREQVSHKIKQLNPVMISQIERGEKSIVCSTLYELTKVYDFSEDDILLLCCPRLLLKEIQQDIFI